MEYGQCLSRGVRGPTPRSSQKPAPRGGGGDMNKSGSRRITARSSLGYAYHTVLLPPLCSDVQSIHTVF